MRSVPLLCLALVACGSDSVTAPTVDGEREAILPPVAYAEWYYEVENCLGMAGDFEAIHWYEMPGYIVLPDGSEHIGHFAAPDTITIAKRYIASDWAVKLYMIQHVTQADSVSQANDHCRN